MVREQIASRGIADEAVLNAMERVLRERFVLPGYEDRAYDDSPLPIGSGQTISQPFIVAQMSAALEIEPGDRVLEIGAGSGYGAAVLAEMGAEVYSIEVDAELAAQARRRLAELGYDNVRVIHADGTQGWREAAPYDAISVTAGGPHLPDALEEQLVPGGRLVIPLGPTAGAQTLVQLRHCEGGGFRERSLGLVRFVPLVSTHGTAPGRSGK